MRLLPPFFVAVLMCIGNVHAAEPLRIISFNVRTPADTEPQKRWPDRRDAMVTLINERRPAVMGTQELVKEQADYLAAHLPGYRWFGEGRRGGDGDEHMGIFYDSTRVRVIESGNYWLSDTPDIVGSISWDHPYPRMVTWGLFERVGDRRRFYLLNTHLPYRAEDEPARERGAQLIVSRLSSLPKDIPVILTGDFNTEPGSATHAAFLTALKDARDIAAHVQGPRDTFHDFTGVGDRQLDWILLRGADVERFTTLDQRIDGILPSDHFPLEVDLRLPTQQK